MRAPRVLVCGTVLSQGVGGVRRHNVELLPRAARLLAAEGGSMAVMASRDGLAFELPSEIEVLSSEVPARPALARFARESLALRAHLESARRSDRPFDWVHTAHLPAPRALGVPFTMLMHDLKSVAAPTSTSLSRWIGHKVIAEAARRAAALLCVSTTLADELRTLTGPEAAPIRVVPNGCDHLPLRPRAAQNEPYLLFVGRLEPRKNVELLLRVLASAPEWPELRLAGDEQGQHGVRLRELARELGVAQRVRFLGAVDDVRLAELYSTCACVVLPSLREGFDLPLVEALRAGAPTAASDLAVHRELAGEHASYFDPRSIESALDALRTARSSVHVGATWDDTARALVDVWRDGAHPAH